MTTRTLTASVLAALALAAPASADSISYIKDGDVWLTTPDGSRQFQVTTSGAYAYASQADDGTFIALSGERLHRLDRFGNVLADFATPVSDGHQERYGNYALDDTTTNHFHGPFDPEISPDGTKVSYTYYWQHYTFNPIWNKMAQYLSSGTAITHPDRLTAWDEFGGNLTGWIQGSWVDNDSLLRSDAGVALSEHAVIDHGIAPGGAKPELVRWFREGIFGSDQFRDPEMTRDGTKLAFITEEPAPVDWHVRIYRTTGAPPAAPEPCFRITPSHPHDDKKDAPSSPSWSPDGMSLAYADHEGIHAVTGIDLSGECKLPAGAAEKVIVPGAKQPDWGPADVPAARPQAPAPAGPATPAAPPANGPKATVPATLAVRTLRGRRLTVVAPAAGTVRVTVKRGRKVVGRAAAKVAAAGPKTLTLTGRPRGKVAVTVRFAPRAGGATMQATRRLTAR